MARGKLEPAMLERAKPMGGLPEGAALDSKVFGVKLPKEISQVLQSMPQADRVALLRTAITEAALKHWPEGEPLPEWAAEFSPSISAS
ncbi:hypothetical protein DOP62_14340 (plasmid) [Synechococcus elongatus PCC 11801]|uniref:Uncharacterized protein n=1 Tax=Synechococcus elongatus PCC 11801 TaxID=2219813 RepID=A0ACD5A332_SYNEL